MTVSSRLPFLVVLLGAAGPAFAQAPAPPKLSTVKPVARDLAVPREVVGVLRPSAVLPVQALVGGAVKKVAFPEGGRVKKGALLFELDAPDLVLALAQARAEVQVAEKVRDEAKRTLAVLRRSIAIAPGGASKEEVERADLTVARYEAEVQAAQLRAERARIKTTFATVTAPFDGWVGRSAVVLGEYAVPAQDRDRTLATLVQTNPLHCVFALDEEAHAALVRARAKKGKGWVPTLRAGPVSEKALPLTGRLDFLDGAFSARGTIEARAVLPNPAGALLPGQRLRVQLDLAITTRVLVVPRLAVHEAPDGKGAWVFTLDARGQVHKRAVRAGGDLEGGRIVLSGLDAGEDVLVTPGSEKRP